MSDETKREIDQQRFARFFSAVNRGDFLAECGAELAKVNDQLSTVASNNGVGKGSILIELRINHGRDGIVEVTPVLKTKLPVPVRGKAIFWSSADGDLATKDPRQTELPLREVKGPGEKTKEVPAVLAVAKEV
jgi:hypothetical protein